MSKESPHVNIQAGLQRNASSHVIWKACGPDPHVCVESRCGGDAYLVEGGWGGLLISLIVMLVLLLAMLLGRLRGCWDG